MFFEFSDIQDISATEISVTVPGLNFFEIHTDVASKTSKISDLFHAGRVLPNLLPTPPSFILCDSRLGIYDAETSTCQYDVQQSLYTSKAIDLNFTIRSQITSYDVNSFTLRQVMLGDCSEEVYATRVACIHLASRDSMKKVAMPEWFTRLLKKNGVAHRPYIYEIPTIDPQASKIHGAYMVYKFLGHDGLPPASTDSYIFTCCLDVLGLCEAQGCLTNVPKHLKHKYLKRVKGWRSGSCRIGNMTISMETYVAEEDLVFRFIVVDGVSGQHVASFTMNFFCELTEDVVSLSKRQQFSSLFRKTASPLSSTSIDSIFPFKLTDFEIKTGQVSLHCIAQIGLLHRWVMMAYAQKIGVDFSRITAFLVAGNYTVHPDFHTLARSGFFNKTPVNCTLANVGKSSMDFDVNYRAHGRTVLNLQSRMVIVDQTQRRPTEESQRVLSKFGVVKAGEVFEYLKAFRLPDDCFSYAVKVLPRDIDHNNHCTHASYVTFCAKALDAYGEREKRRFDELRVTKFSVFYSGECLLGDELDVRSWEDIHDRGTLMIVILKNSKPVFYCTVHFENQRGDQIQAKL